MSHLLTITIPRPFTRRWVLHKRYVGLSSDRQPALAIDPTGCNVALPGKERSGRPSDAGKMDDVHELLKRSRDTGLLMGLCSDTVEALEHAVERD